MGLDMYLDKHYYVKNWESDPPEDKYTVIVQKGGLPAIIAMDRIKYIITEEMYWRKSNAIHKWFVDNVQDGKDECQTTEVSYSNIETLLNLVSRVLENHDLANELLPTAEGFFFGSTDYDESYYDDLKDTKAALERILNEKDGGWLTYHASW